MERFGAAHHGHFFARTQQNFNVYVIKTRNFFAVDRRDSVTCLEAQFFTQVIDPNAILQAIIRHIGIAIVGHHAGVNHNGDNEVDRYAAQQNDQTLPRRFGSKLPRLSGLLHLLSIHRLVHHPGNFHIAAQGKPADAVFGPANFLFDQGKPGVKKEVKLFYARFERNGRQKVAEFVQDDQQRKAQDKLEDLYRHKNVCEGTMPA